MPPEELEDGHLAMIEAEYDEKSGVIYFNGQLFVKSTDPTFTTMTPEAINSETQVKFDEEVEPSSEDIKYPFGTYEFWI